MFLIESCNTMNEIRIEFFHHHEIKTQSLHRKLIRSWSGPGIFSASSMEDCGRKISTDSGLLGIVRVSSFLFLMLTHMAFEVFLTIGTHEVALSMKILQRFSFGIVYKGFGKKAVSVGIQEVSETHCSVEHYEAIVSFWEMCCC